MSEIPKYIVDVYNDKKKACIPRAIEFNFTLEEFYRFWKLKDEVTCFYSGKEFCSKAPAKGSLFDLRPTIERIDDEKGYSLDNCVWVNSTCNKLKNEYILLKKPEEDMDLAYRSTVVRIKKILNNESYFEEQFKVYKQNKLTLTEENVKAAEAHRELTEKLNEVYLCELYYKFGKQLLVDLKKDFDMSFSEFKRIITCKRCKITKRDLPVDIRERALYIKDKTLPINVDNVLCTTVKVSNALDTFSVHADLDYDMMKEVFYNIK